MANSAADSAAGAEWLTLQQELRGLTLLQELSGLTAGAEWLTLLQELAVHALVYALID